MDMFDPDEDWPPQFAGRRAIVDLGGWGRREHTSQAVEAGVELWHVLGYGLDHLDLEFLLHSGVTVAHTPGSCSAQALADHAMLLTLACTRRIKDLFANLQEGVFYYPWTNELTGSRLLLLGVGASVGTFACGASQGSPALVTAPVLDGDAATAMVTPLPVDASAPDADVTAEDGDFVFAERRIPCAGI